MQIWRGGMILGWSTGEVVINIDNDNDNDNDNDIYDLSNVQKLCYFFLNF